MIQVICGDITTFQGDAIVNAANEGLRGGGGVDGAIHRAAGPELIAECRQIGHCPTGEARITKGYRLPARFVIHTVGPIWHGGDADEADKLRSCYVSSLKLAADAGCRSLAFPSISTGVYGYPVAQAAQIAMDALVSAQDRYPEMDVTMVCFSEADRAVYAAALCDQFKKEEK